MVFCKNKVDFIRSRHGRRIAWSNPIQIRRYWYRRACINVMDILYFYVYFRYKYDSVPFFLFSVVH